jgi:hypothetical protein
MNAGKRESYRERWQRAGASSCVGHGADPISCAMLTFAGCKLGPKGVRVTQLRNCDG